MGVGDAGLSLALHGVLVGLDSQRWALQNAIKERKKGNTIAEYMEERNDAGVQKGQGICVEGRGREAAVQERVR